MKRNERAGRRKLGLSICPQRLEDRLMLSITVDNQTYVAMAGSTLTVNAANGVLNGATGGTPPYTAHDTGLPQHYTSFTFNSDGSFSYAPGSGILGTAADSFYFDATDNYFGTSNHATATINVEYSVTSAVNETKPPVDVVGVRRPIIGGAGGQSTNEIPAGVDDLALQYNQTAAHPTPTIEGNFTTSLPTAPTQTETVTATLTFNGVAQSPVYYSL
ncbi:MAG TPA: hypothetical protein VND64_37505, partial [Pirellulales bacterium]|nr:hypothetical protein [Pirellulales bacterium]